MSVIDRFKHGVDVVKFKADQQMQINNLHGEINKLKRKISGLRAKIASVVLNLYKEGTLGNDELEELCRAIEEVNIQIKEKEEQIIAIRAESTPQLDTCGNCGHQIPANADFCPDCGQKVIQDVQFSEQEE